MENRCLKFASETQDAYYRQLIQSYTLAKNAHLVHWTEFPKYIID